ncbi:MAG: ComEC/Rec2 family competence protein, partial [Micromonosporaceae bacterium]
TAAWPGGVTGGLLLAVALAALLILVRGRTARRVLAVSAAAALVGVAGVQTTAPGWPPPDWAVVACDVAQGDALAVRTAPGQAVVIDTGPSGSAADRCLRRLGVTSIPLLVISHFHADHVGGLGAVFRGREIAAVAGPSFAEPAPAHSAVAGTAGRHGAPLLAVTPGWRYEAGQVRLDVLGPERPQRGTRSDPNNNSVILLVRVPGLTVLLAGDAEVERQQAMLASGEPVRADLLKVPHHGSAYQDPEFLTAVDPSVALVSVGVDNDYGHPNPSVMHRLGADGARVFRTDRCGDIAVARGGTGRLEVTCRGPQPGERPR